MKSTTKELQKAASTAPGAGQMFDPQNLFNRPQKFDSGKPRPELVPPELILGIGAVLAFGAKKYAAGNWATGDGFEWSRLYGAMLRHLMAWAGGEDLDSESGLSHLYHAGCMLAFLTAHVERGKGFDDRVSVGTQHGGVD